MGITGLLDRFSIPSLQKLQVIFRWDSFDLDKPGFTLSDYPASPHTAFTSFIQRSACSITSLHFMDVHLSCQELCDVIHCTNTLLERLAVDGVGEPAIPCVNDDVLRLLTWQPSDGWGICPHPHWNSVLHSVASAQADVFATKLSKIGKILRIFDNLDEIKSRWVLCQN
jgi:hypothetical protein